MNCQPKDTIFVPLFVGAVAILNHSTSDRDDELEQLKQRVDDLESDRN